MSGAITGKLETGVKADKEGRAACLLAVFQGKGYNY